jgi:predicted nucleotidyltransferase
METPELLQKIKSALQAAHGPRLKGVLLYGSRARGNAEPDSDWDILVLLEGPIELTRDIERNVAAVYPLILETGFVIHAHPVDVNSYEAQEYPIYQNAKREGVVA